MTISNERGGDVLPWITRRSRNVFWVGDGIYFRKIVRKTSPMSMMEKVMVMVTTMTMTTKTTTTITMAMSWYKRCRRLSSEQAR
jgi:hypothetical protein